MKKLLVSALVAGAILAPMQPSEAYHVIKQHRNAQPVVEQQNTTVVEKGNQALTATASARTDRSLLSEDTPASVYGDNSVQNSAPVQAVKGEYLMRGGDQLQIMILGHEDLSTKPGSASTPYIVRPDGNLTMPLIGDVYCTNKTVKQVTQEITTRLAEYLIDPQVTINISRLGTTRVYVLGEVRAQGLYELEKSHRLIDAISRAGGFSDKSAKRKVFVVREGMDEAVTQINITDLWKKGMHKANIELQEGDCVYLTSNHKVGLRAILNTVYSALSSYKKADDI